MYEIVLELYLSVMYDVRCFS